MHLNPELRVSAELREELSGIATSLVAAMALVGFPPEKAMAEFRRRLKEIIKREGLSPEEIAYLRGKIEGWPPGYAEEWAAGYAEGLAKGRAKAILTVLEARGLPISVHVRERITTCTDLDALLLWFDRSLTVTTAEEMSSEDPKACAVDSIYVE